jgi:hypothetical protein
MTPDPAQRLADTGSRVLRIVQPLAVFSELDRFPDAYENLLLDPLEILSDICGDLLEWSGAAPVASEHDGSPGETGSRLVPDPNARTRSPFPSAVAAAPTVGVPRDTHGPRADPWAGSPTGARFGTATPDPGDPPSFEQSRRAVDAHTGPFPDEPGADLDLLEALAATSPGGPAAGSASAEQTSERFEQPAGRGPEPRGVPGSDDLPAKTSPPGVQDLAQASPRGGPAVGERPVAWRADTGEDGIPARGIPEAGTTPANRRDGVRLAAGPSRFAAMLREHVVDPDAEDPSEIARDGAPAFSDRPEDDASGIEPMNEPEGRRPDGWIRVEEIMEKLADELETGFVRTYGSQGS